MRILLVALGLEAVAAVTIISLGLIAQRLRRRQPFPYYRGKRRTGHPMWLGNDKGEVSEGTGRGAGVLALIGTIIMFGLLAYCHQITDDPRPQVTPSPTVAVAPCEPLCSHHPMKAQDTDGWEPINLTAAIALAGMVDREDWTGCEINYGDTTYVRCPDGFTMES
jgi:hypothetical protein